MGLGPRRHRRSTQQPCGVDHISALPDDLLLLILAGLGCSAAAARTSGLSRRWRGLWARVGDISLHDVPFQWLEGVLSVVARSPPPVVSLIEIHVPRQDGRVPREQMPGRAKIASLLRAAARLAPERLHFALPETGSHPNPGDVHLPCFPRATLIVLESLPFVLRAPATAGFEFAALETLLLLDCVVVDKDLVALLSRCPRLCVFHLRFEATNWIHDHRWITVHSATLQELVIDSETTWVGGIDIVAPVLKELKLSFWAYKQASISISAPMVEKLSWCCHYVAGYVGFGLWSLTMLRLQTAKTQEQLPSLRIYASSNSAYHFSDEEANLAPEIEKHEFFDFSALELYLSTMGHVLGAFVLRLLEMKQIHSVIRRLKVVQQSSQEKESCPANCPCEHTDWRTQTISLSALEELEIYGFEGEDHEHDLLELILDCAPLLRRLTVKMSPKVSSINHVRTKIYDLTAYSSVDCIAYLS